MPLLFVGGQLSLFFFSGEAPALESLSCSQELLARILLASAHLRLLKRTPQASNPSTETLPLFLAGMNEKEVRGFLEKRAGSMEYSLDR